MPTNDAVLAYHLPTRPYDVIAAVNFNGHSVHVSFNDHRGYWIAWYTWSGRNVLRRGCLADCLRAAKDEYDRGAPGDSVGTHYPTRTHSGRMPSESAEDFKRLCVEAGYVVGPSGGEVLSWRTPLHDKVGDALSWEKTGIVPAVTFLVTSKTVEEYDAKIREYLDSRAYRQGRG